MEIRGQSLLVDNYLNQDEFDFLYIASNPLDFDKVIYDHSGEYPTHIAFQSEDEILYIKNITNVNYFCMSNDFSTGEELFEKLEKLKNYLLEKYLLNKKLEKELNINIKMKATKI